jgi:hypothetical protein
VDPIIVEGLLVQAEGEHVRLILEPYCLDFDIDDLLDVRELPWPAGLIEGTAIPARVTLKPGARVLQLASAVAYRDVLWERRLPFALATRRTSTFDVQPVMKQREDTFFAARGLKERLS